MTRRRAIIAAVLIFAAVALGAVRYSGAAFTDSSTSTASGSTDDINRYLHIYSQSTDPDHSTGYCTRRGTSPAQPAATGADHTLAVNLGGVGRPASFTADYLFSLKIAPAPLPRGLTQVTLSVTAGPDPATGLQPLTMTGVNTVTGAGGAKYWFSVDVNVTNSFAPNTLYTPHLYVTVTYTGYTTTYYQYDIPVKVYTGSGAGPNIALTAGRGSARGLTKTGPSGASRYVVPVKPTKPVKPSKPSKPAHTAKPSPSATPKTKHVVKPGTSPKPSAKPSASPAPSVTATPSSSPSATAGA